MGTQQSRSGHGRQGSQQQGQQTERRPEQDRDLQRNKQSDRSQQQHRQGGGGRGQQQASGSGSGQSAPSGQMQERQQSQLGGNRDFTHKMENEGREQNREQQNMRRQQSQQNVHGEGNYAASKQYNEATKDYTQSGRVDDAARAAAPKSDADAREMDAAEAEGKRHAKGEDPALSRRASSSSGESSATPRPGHEEP
jgi:hypothetical protein